MKQWMVILTLTLATLFERCDKPLIDHPQTVNPLLEDSSFVRRFGRKPTEKTDEDLRIKTHLAYVEHLLRKKEANNLTPALQKNRKFLLDLLHTYWTAGIFPRNYDYQQRVPCFIDKDGRICAVGYLVEQTAGRAAAEEINRRHQYDNVLAMNSQEVDGWIAASGLTREECAMIQPAYGSENAHYDFSSAVLGGINASLSTVNATQISKGARHKAVPVISLVTGAGSVIYGAMNIGKYGKSGGFYATNESRKAFSLVNIGLGTATMVVGTWNLLANRRKRNKSLTWNVYGYPTTDRRMGLGCTLVKKL